MKIHQELLNGRMDYQINDANVDVTIEDLQRWIVGEQAMLKKLEDEVSELPYFPEWVKDVEKAQMSKALELVDSQSSDRSCFFTLANNQQYVKNIDKGVSLTAKAVDLALGVSTVALTASFFTGLGIYLNGNFLPEGVAITQHHLATQFQLWLGTGGPMALKTCLLSGVSALALTKIRPFVNPDIGTHPGISRAKLGKALKYFNYKNYGDVQDGINVKNEMADTAEQAVIWFEKKYQITELRDSYTELKGSENIRLQIQSRFSELNYVKAISLPKDWQSFSAKKLLEQIDGKLKNLEEKNKAARKEALLNSEQVQDQIKDIDQMYDQLKVSRDYLRNGCNLTPRKAATDVNTNVDILESARLSAEEIGKIPNDVGSTIKTKQSSPQMIQS